MTNQNRQCPLCSGAGSLPPGVFVEKFEGSPPEGAFTRPHGAQNIQLEFLNTNEPIQAKVKVPKAERPPLGLQPRKFWLTDRALEIMRALTEYVAAGKPPNIIWAEELTEIVNELANL